MRWVILIAAILVWINVYAFIERTQTMPAPLLIENLDSTLAIAEPITIVDATINGGVRHVLDVSDQTLQFSIDASRIKTIGKYTLDIKPKLLPKQLKLVGFSPKQIQISIEAVASKTVPVVALPKGSPNDKFSVQSLTPVPGQVTVWGAPSLLGQISEAIATVDVTGHRASFSTPTTIGVQDGNRHIINSLRLTPDTVQVSIEIVAGASVRNLGLKPTFAGELPGGFWIQEVKFDPPVIQVRGPQKILDSLTSLSSTAITLSDRRASFNDQVAVDLPDGIELVGENLVMAHVVIGSSEGTRQFDIASQYVNVTEGFGVTTINPSSVQVVVSGDPKTINQLKRTDIKLNLDLKGTLSGSNKITITPAMFNLPPNFQVVSFTPNTVEVVMSRL
jgi:YbbR domain-containing protein